MMFNVLLDVGIGSIPIVGDVFDWLFEENIMNLQLLMRHRDRRRPPRTPRQMVWFAVVIFGIVLFAGIAMVVALIVLAIWLAGKR